MKVPTNDQLAERAKSLDAHTVVRDWLHRHAGSTPLTWVGHRDAWLDWAASNFLADPEVGAHLVAQPSADTETLRRVKKLADKVERDALASANPDAPESAEHVRAVALYFVAHSIRTTLDGAA